MSNKISFYIYYSKCIKEIDVTLIPRFAMFDKLLFNYEDDVKVLSKIKT